MGKKWPFQTISRTSHHFHDFGFWTGKLSKVMGNFKILVKQLKPRPDQPCHHVHAMVRCSVTKCMRGKPAVRGVRVPLFSWFPQFWKFSRAKISAFYFILNLAYFWHFYPILHCFSLLFICGVSHLGQSQKWSSSMVKFQVACVIKTSSGLNRVEIEVHGSKLFSVKHGFSAEIQAIKDGTSALEVRRNGIEKFNLFKQWEEKTENLFLVFKRSLGKIILVP